MCQKGRQMYTKIHTQKDVLRERYLYQSELTPLGFPKLLPVHATLSGLNAVSFCEAAKEKIRRRRFATFLLTTHGLSHYGISRKSIFRHSKILNTSALLTSHFMTLCQRSCSYIKCTEAAPWHGGYL